MKVFKFCFGSCLSSLGQFNVLLLGVSYIINLCFYRNHSVTHSFLLVEVLPRADRGLFQGTARNKTDDIAALVDLGFSWGAR